MENKELRTQFECKDCGQVLPLSDLVYDPYTGDRRCKDCWAPFRESQFSFRKDNKK